MRHRALAEAARREGGRPDRRRDGHPRRGAGRALGARQDPPDRPGGRPPGRRRTGRCGRRSRPGRSSGAPRRPGTRPAGPREDDQGDRAVRSLHDRGREVGHGRARGADDGHGGPRDLGQAEGQEPCRALVDPHVQADPARAVQAQGLEGQRGGARPRREHHLAHALMDQLSQEGAGQRGGRVHGWTTPTTVSSESAPLAPAHEFGCHLLFLQQHAPKFAGGEAVASGRRVTGTAR